MNNICKSQVDVFLFSFCFLVCSFAYFCHAANTLTKGESLKDGDDALISTNEIFKLGFFSTGNSSLRYVGIWYNKIELITPVWVANRNTSISNGNGTLTIGDSGNLMVLDGNNTLVWSSNASIESNNTAAILGNDGNLILSSSENIGNMGKAYWTSFDNPTDSYLPGMRLKFNPRNGEKRVFISWKSASDPSTGNYSMGVDPQGAAQGAPQIVMWEQLKRRWRSGQWDDRIFTGVPFMAASTNFIYGFKLSSPEPDGSMYFSYNQMNSSDLLRFRLTWDGFEEQLKWDEGNKNWTEIQVEPLNDCELYNFCGNFGFCKVNSSPKCSCMEGFVARDGEQWNMGNWSGGCVRRNELQCRRITSEAGQSGGADGFKKFKGMKLPDFDNVESAGNSETCKDKCFQNCSCNAYADVDGIGCMIWVGDLIDVQNFDDGGNTLHIRLAHSEFGGSSRLSNAAIISIAVVGSFFLALSLWLLWKFRGKLKVMHKVSSLSCCKSKRDDMPVMDASRNEEFSTDLSGPADILMDVTQVNGADLPMFNFNTIAIATNNFSDENKLGQGGFGPVYQGKLPEEQEIAVKRLSRKSVQGLEEFKNEVILIAKLQHRNLVRLLGCCIQGEEMMLVYEYMPNKSLDFFLFDTEKQALLNWKKRFAIIEGIARGLLYLHRDSRLRIIHRDLKASNILLDEEMNPKISDFGMARMFGGNQHEANTIRVVGTYGYMSPEYAMEGLFSVKSDVYSFGVLLLEIISGKRNNSFRSSEFSNLIGYAWTLWNEGRAMELVDRSIRDSCSESQVLRCIHVGMLCVQDSTMYRPDMANVVLMLESQTPTLQTPRQPTFTSMRNSVDVDFSLEAHDTMDVSSSERKGTWASI
ncbi:G-type lectin S-receptor-like serine/threonine-protein kinase B120 isoform X1 [Pistacia vera]|uniref:G-type lectin S-receptor-like serine/threonine-protein kinase B120 isoform X1 n=1 Tax=Pistacia vera TaxID=55513 RepID=UPI001263414D|nr:G-type lectin S-receptor-like serine/threonine-protein kinase B120 isoform X1 [Pistacia vera]